MNMRRRPAHPYPRTARLSALVHEILADELERIDDERLLLVTIMSVVVDPDLRHATVFVDTPEGADRDAEVIEALEEMRIRLQAAVAKQARMKRTPLLAFKPDTVEREAGRVEDVLRDLDVEPDA
ncbi:MAG: ribosome-binding factor [Acidimicrobiaceae bacterium]|jgi:ribosome-binding factor A